MAEQTARGTSGASPAAPYTARTSTDMQSRSVAGRVREQASNQLNTQKNRATEGLGTVANAVRGTSQRLRDERHDTAARFVEQAANQLERLSNGLRQKDVGELMNDAQRLARQRPAVFVGSAFAVGFLSARFMKSSSQRDRGGAREAEYRVEGTATVSGSTPIQGSERAGSRPPR